MAVPPFSNQHLRALRADTPATQRIIHLNNAGASLVPGPVRDAVQNYLAEEAEGGGYETAARRANDIQAFYSQLASLFGGLPAQYAYCSSATDAFNKALGSLPVRAGDTWLTTRHDYASNQIALLQAAERFGIRLLVARDREEGGVDPDDLQRLLRLHQPRLVVVTQVPSHTGLVQPVAEIGQLCRAAGAWYLVDGCQAAGQLNLDLPALGCDFFAATFRKCLRRRGVTGFLYVSERVLEAGLAPLFLDLHSARWTAPDHFSPVDDARRFELWERSYALMLGAGAALAYAESIGMPAIEMRVKRLAARLRELLGAIPACRVLDRGGELSGIIALQLDHSGPEIMDELRTADVHTSIAYGNYAQYTMAAQGIPWALRLSPHYYNTEEELEHTAEVIGQMIRT